MSKNVFVLGAGATRGASFVGGMKRGGRCLPPLDADFFTQLQRVSNKSHSVRLERLVKGLVEWFGANYRLSMEQVFIHLEHADRMLRHLGKEATTDHKKVVELKRDLIQAIAIVLGESLTNVRSGGQGSYEFKPCDWHDKLVSYIAEPGDSFISFNYDCVLDDSLRRKATEKWNAHYGYCFKLSAKGHGLEGDGYWGRNDNVTKENSIKVHKVHGSLHFTEQKGVVRLKQRPYGNPGKSSNNLKFAIVPPESSKSYENGRLGQVMQNANQSLRRADRLVVIGYSLPASDQHAEALFRFGVKKKSLSALVIVNPDPQARYRIRTALQTALKPSTRVLSFDFLEEFINAEQSIWKL